MMIMMILLGGLLNVFFSSAGDEDTIPWPGAELFWQQIWSSVMGGKGGFFDISSEGWRWWVPPEKREKQGIFAYRNSEENI